MPENKQMLAAQDVVLNAADLSYRNDIIPKKLTAKNFFDLKKTIGG